MEHSGRADGPVPYLVIEPTSSRPDTPLLIALHGRGDHAEQFARLVRRLHLPMRVLVGRAPLPFGSGRGAQWFDRRVDGSEGVVARVDDMVAWMAALRTRYPEAPPPALLGFSQGAMLALQTLAMHPDKVGPVVALSGDLRAPGRGVLPPRPVPVLLTAGEKDRLVTPAAMARAHSQLRGMGHEVELLRFDGGHGVPREVVTRARAFLMRHGVARP